jgi:cell division protein FtsW
VSREIYRRYSFDKLLFLAVLGMIAFGLVMVFSSSAPRGIEERGNSFYYFVQQVIGAVTGLALLLFILSWSRPFYKNTVFVYGMLTLSIGLLSLALIMPAVRNANRWIFIAGFRFQPSELAKISLLCFSWFSRNPTSARPS